MSQQKAQIISPIDTFTTPGLNVTGVVTSTSFVGSATGTATGLASTTLNISAGIVTATTLYGSGASLTGVAQTAFVGQSTTSQSPTTTINLSLGNVIYFTHNTDTTVAFANTSTTQKLKFIRIKDATTTARSITWPTNVYWNNGTAPTLITNQRTTAAQTFNLTTRDGGVTWYAYQEVNSNPQTFALYSWGNNALGEAAQNNTTPYSSPTQIPGTPWNSISGGFGISLATKTDGTLWAWGRNQFGALGQNNRTYYSSPVQIPGTTWSSIGANARYSLATKTDGTLWSWGRNQNGQLGQNNTTDYSSPVQIPGTTWRSVVKSNSNSYHTLATKTDGTLWSWGRNIAGELGQNDRTYRSSPVQIPGTTWSSISLGFRRSSATKTDGTLWAWGRGSTGSLGQNDRADRSSPVQIPGTTWSSISDGSNYSLATKTDGTLWSWGYNAYGELGQSNLTNRSSPIQIPGTTWNSISAGYRNAFSIKTDGTLWAWGDDGSSVFNDAGALGQNQALVHYSSPVQIPGTQWSSINSGYYNTLAIQIIN